MGLVALALRIATVKTLMNATLAADRVYDSAVDPIDQRISEEAAPVLVIFTEDNQRTVTGRDLRNATHALELVIEAAVASQVMIEAKEGEPTFAAVEIPHTDAGLEISLDLIDRQIMRALMVDDGLWPTLWRRIALATPKIITRRGAGADKGVRFAARQHVITVEALSEPGFGAIAEEFWHDFLAALEADDDPNLPPIAAAVRREIEVPTLVDWRRAIADLGASISTAGAIGIGPLRGVAEPQGENQPYPQPDEEAAPFSGIHVEIDGAPDWTLDGDAAEDALGPEDEE